MIIYCYEFHLALLANLRCMIPSIVTGRDLAVSMQLQYMNRNERIEIESRYWGHEALLLV